MLSIVNSFGLSGLNGYMVKVEVDINKGLPSYDVVGLADISIKESKQRVRSAIKNSNLKFPIDKITLPGKSHGWRSLVGFSPWGR